MLVLPRLELEKNGHDRHAASDRDALCVLNVPRAQFVHAAGPVSALYFPALHDLHGSPFGPVNPALHWHCALFVLPRSENELSRHGKQFMSAFAPVLLWYVSAGQGVQLPPPKVGLKVPAGQVVQVEPPYPRSQTHCVKFVVPSSSVVCPIPHRVHSVAFPPPPYDPMGHGTHRSSLFLYRPGGHWEQSSRESYEHASHTFFSKKYDATQEQAALDDDPVLFKVSELFIQSVHI
jgi:hypothetical protein